MNYKIEHASLGVDHASGGLNAVLSLSESEEKPYTITPVMRNVTSIQLCSILKVVGVGSWENLVGQYCRYSDGVLCNLLDDKKFIDLKKVI